MLFSPGMCDAFAEHNAEQRAVWDAFRAGHPVRVPVLVVSNPRIMFLDPMRNTQKLTFERYMHDPELMLRVCIDCDWWARHHLWFDHEMGLPGDGWRCWIDFQNFYEAAWLGAPVHFPDNNCPYASPLLDDDNRNMLFDRGIPDPIEDGGWMQRAWGFYDHWMARKDAGVEYHGRPIVSVLPVGEGTDGPFTLAMELRGQGACLDLVADPDYFHRLMDFITEATILRMRAYRERLGRPVRSRDFFYADDSIALISTGHFREHVLPYHRRIVEAFWTGEGKLSIHLCGDASRHFVTLKDELGVSEFDTGFPIDLHEMRRQLGPDVILQGGPRAEVLRTGPVSEIEAVTRDLVTGSVAREGPFVLREANNLAPCTPPEHVKAMYDTAREWGRY